WAIGAGEDYDDQAYQDDVESTALYDLLENEIVPTFYERSSDDVPREWTRIMKNSMRTVNAEFNTNRMVEEYTERFYIPCIENAARLSADGFTRAKELADWRSRMNDGWDKLRIIEVYSPPLSAQPMGSTLPVRATLQLGDIPADEILVEVYHGLLDSGGEIVNGETATLFADEDAGDGTVTFSGDIACRRAGRRGFTVRAVPRKDGYPLDRFETGLVSWWDGPSGDATEDQTGSRSISVHRA
ncbi:MAG: alpha-glucan phosphorylase, partial [Candidatus Krumholzibacteria bacterium]|nr:alpha-glucan phosphorylase [Candidatus Krumholzibacteria bacterium]